VSTPSIVERLAALPALTSVPRGQLEWLVANGQYFRFESGQEIRADTTSGVGLYVTISGRFSIRVDQGGVEREVREVTEGRPTGFLPYSRMTAARGYMVADGPVEFLLIRQADLREMTRECYEFTALCVHEMLDRVRVFKSDDKHQEKMAALGRLSAGLAHELNNPASAVARAAQELDTCRSAAVTAARALGAAGLDEAGARALEALEAAAVSAPDAPVSPLARADAEDRVAEWLGVRGAERELAYPLVDHGLTVRHLDELAQSLKPEQLEPALRYLGAELAARDLSATVVSAAARIDSLVAAVKKHTHMDRAPTLEPIALASHLSDTVALMRQKAAERGVMLELQVDPESPQVEGTVADLNQVWMHLLDNAIDAAPDSGRVSVDMVGENGVVVVRVVDDGAGIPAEDHERVFEPFFTTKDVGQGRGLGLDIVRTVVRNHRGSVDLSSGPGRTEFRVTLPAVSASR
jgi:signal transduction histidine kinase